jgi:GGDEF domain-containing protein
VVANSHNEHTGEMVGPREGLDEIYTQVPGLIDKDDWHKMLPKELQEAHRDMSPLTIIFIDINYMKDVNDELGHLEGDRVIHQVKTIIAQQFRTKNDPDKEPRALDLLAVSSYGEVEPLDNDPQEVIYPDDDLITTKPTTFGGDEFAILCRTDAHGAEAIRSKIRDAFEEFINSEGNEPLHKIGIGLGIGFAVFEPGMSAADLLRKADKDMYDDKMTQKPELKPFQQHALDAARLILENSGIRLREVPRYWRDQPTY